MLFNTITSKQPNFFDPKTKIDAVKTFLKFVVSQETIVCVSEFGRGVASFKEVEGIYLPDERRTGHQSLPIGWTI